MQTNIGNIADDMTNTGTVNTSELKQPLFVVLSEAAEKFASVRNSSVLKLGSYKRAIEALKDILQLTDNYSTATATKSQITYIKKAKALSIVRRSTHVVSTQISSQMAS